jgi:hypothetical protein
MDPVDDQIEAYNERNIDRFLSCYDTKAVIEDGEGNLLMKGHDSIRARYGTLFEENPNLKGRILNRIRVGAYVIDEEEISGGNADGL